MKYGAFQNLMQHSVPRIILSVVLATGAMAPGMGVAASSSFPSPPVEASASIDDTQLVTELSQAHRYEIQVARLAEQRATDANVKAFASAVVRHRLLANADLRQWARSHGVDVALLEEAEVRAETLSNLRGREFDKQFVQTMGIEEMHAVIDRLNNLSAAALDAELRAWAERTLPQVKHQLAAAEKLQARRSAVALQSSLFGS